MALIPNNGYAYIKLLVEGGKITALNDIFDFVPEYIVARDLKKDADRFTFLTRHVENFSLYDLFEIARLCDISETAILLLAVKEYQIQKLSPED